jgi:hypothetical protein
MKRIVILISLLVSFCTLQAQDTIYPFNEDYPFFNDSVYHVIDADTESWCRYIFFTTELNALEHKNVQAVVTGLAIPYQFGYRPEYELYAADTISMQGLLFQIENNDYDNPNIHYTDSVVWNYYETPHVRPYDCHIAFRNHSECGEIDTVVEAYSLYFKHPIEVNGDMFIGIRFRRYNGVLGWHEINRDEGLLDRTFNGTVDSCDTLYPYPAVVHYIYYDNDRHWPSQFGTPYFPNLGHPHSTALRYICPILTIPDTDSFSCPEVEGFAFAGINAGAATLMWDTADGHTFYQIAYGPYDKPIDSLRIDTTSRRFMELFGLSQDIYYQARLRAKCHHACPLHDTVMWTAWTDPVYFYTGDQMPDTSHQQPIGIAPASARMNFAIVPNPTRKGEMPDVVIDPGVPLQGLTLTLHDAAGREVLHTAVYTHRFALPVRSLPAGVYTATLASSQGQSSLRVVIE